MLILLLVVEWVAASVTRSKGAYIPILAYVLIRAAIGVRRRSRAKATSGPQDAATSARREVQRL